MWQKLKGLTMRVLAPSGVGQYKPLLQTINDLESRIQELSDEELKASTDSFRERLAEGETLDDILPEAFAVVRETSRRILGMRHYDVQVLGGIALHNGRVAEMKTGEGKTLVATLPVYLNALAGNGVHVVTVNDYLAQRDANWMGKIYKYLGLTVGIILEEMGSTDKEETQLRQEAYNADITYATNSALVFDYLRDNLATDPKDWVQRGQHFAIVDEVDLLLIDEVRTPLIISGASQEDSSQFATVDRVIRQLKEKEHYKVEWRTRTASLTEEGWSIVEEKLGYGSLNQPKNLKWYHAVYQSVLAHGVYRKDVDYIVTKGEVQLIDEHTGRVSADKRMSDGLHQALEAKEKLRVRPEDRTLARTSYQSFFRLYPKLSGMTGTASKEKGEFQKTYNMGVTVIPTHRPIARKTFIDLVYVDLEDKHQAIADVIEHLQEQGRPVLVGTVSVEESEQLARVLKRRKIRCKVLNAKNHDKEAHIVAQAGRLGAVTISTNMAGRGTDILLGGDPEKLALQKSKPGTPQYKKVLAQARKECAKEHEAVVEAGGLHVIGTSLHEASRLDDQLRGRAGRQGDPGSSQFMISLDDIIYKHYGEAEVEAMMEAYDEIPDGESIPDKSVHSQLMELRKKVAADHNQERAETFKYDLVIEEQRRLIYQWRHDLLAASEDNEDAHEQAETLIHDTLHDLIVAAFEEQEDDDHQRLDIDDHLDSLEDGLSNLFGVAIELPETLQPNQEPESHLLPDVKEQVLALRKERLEKFGEKPMLTVERQLLLETIDQMWMNHLTNIEALEDRLQLMGYAELDPYVLFRNEVGPMFARMLRLLRQRAIALWFAVSLAAVEPEDAPKTNPSKRKRKRKRG